MQVKINKLTTEANSIIFPNENIQATNVSLSVLWTLVLVR